jgi:aryl-alcohol dehydrogenase-like predicted oxidoreductase
MQYRQFGNTELEVSEVGFGAWAIGGEAMIGNTAIGWGKSDDSVSTAAIHAALDAGINFFDTADIYGLGHSEHLLGKVLGKEKNIIIASKAGNVSRNNEFTVDYSYAHIIKACEDSLKRLRRETIDLLQLHTARLKHLEEGDCIKAMDMLQKQGKIRYWGISLNTFEPAREAEFLMQQEIGHSFQLVLNLINQKGIDLLAEAYEKGYGIIARMPLQFGLLTGKFDHELSFSDTDHRKKRVTRELVEATNRELAPVWDLCNKYNCTKAQLSMSYLLSFDEVSVVIPGIRTVKHVKDNTSGLFRLEVKDLEMINELGKEKLQAVMEILKKNG